MITEHALSVLIPLVVLAVLWTLVRHWILPFVLGFALAVALGPSAPPMMASAWATVAGVGELSLVGHATTSAIRAKGISTDADRLRVDMTTRKRISRGFCQCSFHAS